MLKLISGSWQELILEMSRGDCRRLLVAFQDLAKGRIPSPLAVGAYAWPIAVLTPSAMQLHLSVGVVNRIASGDEHINIELTSTTIGDIVGRFDSANQIGSFGVDELTLLSSDSGEQLRLFAAIDEVTSPTTEEKFSEPATLADVLSTLRALRVELAADENGWTNNTLDSYLGASESWLKGVQHRVDERHALRLIVMMLRAARVHS